MRRLILTILVLIAILLAAWFGFKVLTSKPDASDSKGSIPALAVATVLSPNKPLVSFSLTDHNLAPFTQSSFLGQWTLLYFGYGQCPEICPRTLTTVSEIWNLLPSQSQGIQPLRFVFVSLDPQGDRPEDLKKLLARFNSDFIGLTGEESEIQNLSKACSIHSWEDPKASKEGPKIIDHSATLLLINPQGRIHALFSPPHEKEAIASDLKILLKL